MYDNILCKYPIDVEDIDIKISDLTFQSKDTEAQFLDNYEIREDGTLWHETYDIEDRSDPNAEGIMKLLGCMTRINQRWEQVNTTGEIVFYTSTGENRDQWLEFSAYFVDGKLNQIHQINPCAKSKI